MLKGTSLRDYVNTKGHDVFVYEVSGSDSEIADYKAIQGTFLRTDSITGKVLWFSPRFYGDTIKLLIIDTKDKTGKRVIPDLSDLRKAKSMAQQFGGDIGKAMADQIAGQFLGAKATVATAPVQLPPAEEQHVDPIETDNPLDTQ